MAMYGNTAYKSRRAAHLVPHQPRRPVLIHWNPPEARSVPVQLPRQTTSQTRWYTARNYIRNKNGCRDTDLADIGRHLADTRFSSKIHVAMYYFSLADIPADIVDIYG